MWIVPQLTRETVSISASPPQLPTSTDPNATAAPPLTMELADPVEDTSGTGKREVPFVEASVRQQGGTQTPTTFQ